MTAERDLNGGREPANAVPIPVRHEEGRLGEVVLGGDRLQRRVGQEAPENDDSSRIAGEPAVRERIDLIDWRTRWSIRMAGRDVGVCRVRS